MEDPSPTEEMIRRLEWDGALNVRDLGGVPLAQGDETRFGSLVRADNIRYLTDDGWRALEGYGVTRILDLRWKGELQHDPPRDIGIEALHVSLTGDVDPNLDDVDLYIERDDAAGFFASFFEKILERNPPEIGHALRAIAEAPRGVTLFHCGGGKDRTGLIAALLLRIAGARIDDIDSDYALSGPNLAVAANPWVNAAPDKAERRRRMFKQQSPAGAMGRAVELLEERFGSVETYLRGAGLDAEQIERLHARLVSSDRSPERSN